MLLNMRSSDVVLKLALLSVFLTGCDLFKSGEELIFDTQALSSGRLLFASHDTGDPDAALSLFTMEAMLGSSMWRYATADFDFTGPAVSINPGLYWYVGFGKTGLELIDTMNSDSQRITGLGEEQRAVAFDSDSPVRLAYMDGSSSTGFNVVVQSSPTAGPVAVASGASSSVNYWTPSWSPDGQWIVYAKIRGTTNPTGQLWRVRPNGSGAEALPITTTELPTYPIFSPDGTEIFVPGDFTSYKIDDGRVGKFDHIREMTTFQQQLADLGYEVVGSPVSGAVHSGDTVSTFRHTFPISTFWVLGDWIYFDALVASNRGDPPHRVLGVALFAWKRISQKLYLKTPPIPLSDARSEGHAISVMHPTIIP